MSLNYPTERMNTRAYANERPRQLKAQIKVAIAPKRLKSHHYQNYIGDRK